MSEKKSLKQIIRDEFKKSATDPVHFMRKYCVIQHPTKGKMYFNLYPFHSLEHVVQIRFQRVGHCNYSGSGKELGHKDQSYA